MAAPAPNTLDVRPIAPRRMPPTVMVTYEKLAPGESFVLVTDREPSAVRAALETRAARRAEWTYLEAGPDVWRVRITRR